MPLHNFKALLAKLSPKKYLDDAAIRHRQRRSSKLLRRLRARTESTDIDPFRALRRLRDATTKLRLHPRAVSSETTALARDAELEPHFGTDGLLRALMLPLLGGASRLFMYVANETVVQGGHYLEKALRREEGRPLITVSNHVGSIDDPLVTSAVVPFSTVFKPAATRWIMCATDRCFSRSLLTKFFRDMKTLPIERGGGLDQVGMRAAEYRLNQGDWVHIFPEGTRSRTGELLPMKIGVGKLIANCDTIPLVVPFVHSGMQNVIPSGSLIPKTGNKVRILIGEPICFLDVIRLAEEGGWTDKELYVAITDKIGDAMGHLWSELEEKPLPSWVRDGNPTEKSPRVARGVFQLHRAMESIGGISFLRMVENKRSQVQKATEAFARYLDYCRMRRQFVLNMLSG